MSDLQWEISYLDKNEQPTDSFGRVLDTIRAPSSNLKDNDIQNLAKALEKNSVFKGGIDLQENLLTDLSILYLAKSLENSLCQITVLNLSFNNLKEKSGVYIGDLLATGYGLKELYLRSCCVDSLGVQRIFEKLPENSNLRVLDIGIVHNTGLEIIAKYLPSINKLKSLMFQQGNQWSEEAMKTITTSMFSNYSLLFLEITNCEKADFVDQLLSLADRNTSLYREKKLEKAQSTRLDPKNFAEEIQSFIEKSVQNLPVRVYLTNSIGSILNDGIYQLMKFRYKEDKPEKNTAINNVKWLIRYILDRNRF